MLRTLSVVTLLALLPTAALADRAEADACSQKLTGEALNTYNAGIGAAEGGSTLEQAIRPYLEPLHKSGKITEEEARKVGREAADCIRLVHRDMK